MTSTNDLNPCERCGASFIVEAGELDILSRASPKRGEHQLMLSRPRRCPQCRDQDRLAWRNDRSLYSRNCEKCNKSVVSCYASAGGIHVYCSGCWNGDSWDPISYGRPYEASTPFLDQFSLLF